jgi:hypothetical protein
MSLPAFLRTRKTGNCTDIVADLTQFYKAIGCNMFLNVMDMESDFSRAFRLWKFGAKANGLLVCWLIITVRIEETFHWQNITENHPLLHFR